MARRKRDGELNVLGHGSFLDAMSNAVGALAFILLLVVVVLAKLALNYFELDIVSPSSLPEATVGTQYEVALSAIGGNEYYHWSIVEGEAELRAHGIELSTPMGMSTTGGQDTAYAAAVAILRGVPSDSGQVNLQVKVVDTPIEVEAGVWRHQEKSKTFFLDINPPSDSLILPPKIRTDDIPLAISGLSYNLALSAVGGVLPLKWEIQDPLPPGLRLDGDKIVGIPSRDGTWKIKLSVMDAKNRVDRSNEMSMGVVPAQDTLAPLTLF